MMGRLFVGVLALGLLIKLWPFIAAAVALRAAYVLARKWHQARQQARCQAEAERVRRAAVVESERLRALTPADRAWLKAHGWLAAAA